MLRLRVRLARDIRVALLSFQEYVLEIHKAVERANLPVARGKRQETPFRITTGPYLPVGYTSKAEYIDAQLDEYIAPSMFCAQLSDSLCAGIHAVWAGRVPERAPHLRASFVEFCYTVFGEFELSREKAFQQRQSLFVVRRKAGKEKSVDIKSFVSELSMGRGTMRFYLRVTPYAPCTPEDVVKAVGDVREESLVRYHFERTSARLLPIGFPRSFQVE